MGNKKGKARVRQPSPPPLQARADKVGTPRLDPYLRLLARFYEPLVLLKLLGQTRGDQKKPPHNGDDDQFRRRRLLETLAYICDVDKGGSTCTAVAIEETDHKYVFWFAVNSRSEIPRAVLGFALGYLSDMLAGLHPDDGVLLEQCVTYASLRIKKEVKGLRSAIKGCLERLESSKPDAHLSDWLKSIRTVTESMSHLEICRWMKQETVSPDMDRLKRYSERAKKSATATSRRSEFADARHFIGRLACRIRAHEDLIADVEGLEYLFSSFEIRQVPFLECAPMPQRDAHTNLQGILNRMLPQDSDDKQNIEILLHRQNNATGLFGRFANEYETCKPIVHAEIQVLEQFYSRRRQYLKGDKFIGCSKPACFCCMLYFKYHPARVANATSHQKIWLNWGPPLIQNFQKGDKKSMEQRDVLNKMIASIREELFDQLLRRTEPAPWHPDSVTAISDRTVEEDDGVLEDSTSSSMDDDGVLI